MNLLFWRKKQIPIPEEVLNEFEKVERRYKKSIKNGESNPYKCLWEHTREEHFGRGDGESSEDTSDTGVHVADVKRDNVQSGDNLSTKQDMQRTEGDKGTSNKSNIFSRIFRKS